MAPTIIEADALAPVLTNEEAPIVFEEDVTIPLAPTIVEADALAPVLTGEEALIVFEYGSFPNFGQRCCPLSR